MFCLTVFLLFLGYCSHALAKCEDISLIPGFNVNSVSFYGAPQTGDKDSVLLLTGVCHFQKEQDISELASVLNTVIKERNSQNKPIPKEDELVLTFDEPWSLPQFKVFKG